MPILHIILVIVVVGVVLYLINRYVPMEARIKQLLGIVVVLALILWLLQVFGILGSLNSAYIN